ncbi:MAG: hypothetical protein H0X29_08685 [Parachlamydiaceae bacterium]|nr:hypothetical protein [Parachlamydiaceae bacterium]
MRCHGQYSESTPLLKYPIHLHLDIPDSPQPPIRIEASLEKIRLLQKISICFQVVCLIISTCTGAIGFQKFKVRENIDGSIFASVSITSAFFLFGIRKGFSDAEKSRVISLKRNYFQKCILGCF